MASELSTCPLCRAKTDLPPGRRKLATIESALDDLFEISDLHTLKIAGFSEHELRIVGEFAPAREPELRARYLDVHKIAKRYCNRQKIQCDEKSLVEIARALRVKPQSAHSRKGSAAELCRKLQRAAENSQVWKNWTTEARRAVGELLEYNKADMVLTRKVLMRCCEHEVTGTGCSS